MSMPEKTPNKHKVNKLALRRIIWFGVAIDIFIMDQISKWAVTEIIFRPKTSGNDGVNLIEWYINTPSIIPYSQIKVTSFFNLVMAWNTGVSFSIFSNSGKYMPYILIAVALGVTALFITWLWKAKNHLHGICYALIIGGALGNIADRARFGAVIDFLDFHIMGYHWPAFNISDMAVVIGVGILIIVSLFFDIQAKGRYRKQGKNKRTI